MMLLNFPRLYPVIPANARVITERDIQVGGYLIPKNVSVVKESLILSAMMMICIQTLHTFPSTFPFRL